MKRSTFSVKRIAVLAAILAALLAPLVITNPYMLHVGIVIFIWSILTLGVRIILLAGHLNAAQASFMGMGAYGSALLATKLNWSFWLCLPAAGLMTAILAFIIGIPTLRIKGAYFVMITFAITEVFRHIWMMWKSLFGGPQGLFGIPAPDAIEIAGLTINFASKTSFYYLAFLLLLLSAVIIYRIDMSEMGRILKAIAQADDLAESLGINIMRYKIWAFVIGSFLAGIAGSFWAHYFTYTSPWDFTWMNSVYMLMYAVIGGTASLFGPIIGCFVLIGVDELFRPLQQYLPILIGAILIVILMYVPGGLVEIPARIRSIKEKHK
jgi:branched-chain amino acid transport system permease protein